LPTFCSRSDLSRTPQPTCLRFAHSSSLATSSLSSEGRAMSRRIRVACVAVMLVACARSESGAPMSMQPQDSSANRVPLSAPDVAAARAEEAAALHDIDVNYPPGEGKAHLMGVLTGKLDSGVVDNVHRVHIIEFKNPVWQARLERLYAARARR